jgi:succinate dehydrogenase / fumarate reductase cytochrome b subunit
MTNTLKAPQQSRIFLQLGPSPADVLSLVNGKKLITGLHWASAGHLCAGAHAGNLLLFVGRDAYNAYALLVSNFHVVYYTFELALAAIVVLHAWVGIEIFWRRRQARPEGYSTYQSAGG